MVYIPEAKRAVLLFSVSVNVVFRGCDVDLRRSVFLCFSLLVWTRCNVVLVTLYSHIWFDLIWTEWRLKQWFTVYYHFTAHRYGAHTEIYIFIISLFLPFHVRITLVFLFHMNKFTPYSAFLYAFPPIVSFRWSRADRCRVFHHVWLKG